MDPLLTEIEPSVAQEDEEHSGGYYRFIYCLLLFTKLISVFQMCKNNNFGFLKLVKMAFFASSYLLKWKFNTVSIHIVKISVFVFHFLDFT